MWNMKVYFFSLCVVYCFLVFCLTENVDTTKIECIPLTNCPMAVALVRTKKYAPETIAFLQESHCGMKGPIPMIFCPNFPLCSTEFVKNGTCSHPHNCKILIDYVKDLRIGDEELEYYLEKHRCYSDKDDEFRVCCPQVNDDMDFIKQNDVTPSSPMDSPEDRLLFTGGSDKTDKQNTLPNINNGECGVQSTSDNKITGGTQTELEEYPWMALLTYETKNGLKNGCGGSLISSRFVITAGHCLAKEVYTRFNLLDLKFVILGEHNTKTSTDCIYDQCADPPLRLSIKSTLIHPKFSLPSTLNDVGIIELDRSVGFTDYIKPICLPNKSFQLNGNETFEVAGWGQTYTAPSSDVKLKARLKFAPAEQCKRLNDKLATSKGQICAGRGDGKDTCKGDSGGPLMLGRILGSEFVYSLVGITSYGLTSCGTGPSVYTYVPVYYDWIKANVG